MIFEGISNYQQAQSEGSQSIIIQESNNLVDWSEPRKVQVALPDAGDTWASEAFYDEIDTTIIEDNGMYYRYSADGQITIETSDQLLGN